LTLTCVVVSVTYDTQLSYYPSRQLDAVITRDNLIS